MGNSDGDKFKSEHCAEQLKALSEPLRLRIVDLLRHGEMSVTDIAIFLETEVVNVSHHLKILRQAQILTNRREGRYFYYRLREDLLTKSPDMCEFLDLGCCRIEVPTD